MYVFDIHHASRAQYTERSSSGLIIEFNPQHIVLICISACIWIFMSSLKSIFLKKVNLKHQSLKSGTHYDTNSTLILSL